MQPRQFYTTAKDRVGRPTQKWAVYIKDLLQKNLTPVASKQMYHKHPVLHTTKLTTDNIINLAKDRTAYSVVANNPITKAAIELSRPQPDPAHQDEG